MFAPDNQSTHTKHWYKYVQSSVFLNARVYNWKHFQQFSRCLSELITDVYRSCWMEKRQNNLSSQTFRYRIICDCARQMFVNVLCGYFSISRICLNDFVGQFLHLKYTNLFNFQRQEVQVHNLQSRQVGEKENQSIHISIRILGTTTTSRTYYSRI